MIIKDIMIRIEELLVEGHTAKQIAEKLNVPIEWCKICEKNIFD